MTFLFGALPSSRHPEVVALFVKPQSYAGFRKPSRATSRNVVAVTESDQLKHPEATYERPAHALVALQDTSPRSFRLLSFANLASRLDQHGAGAFSQIRAANEDDVCRCIDSA